MRRGQRPHHPTTRLYPPSTYRKPVAEVTPNTADEQVHVHQLVVRVHCAALAVRVAVVTAVLTVAVVVDLPVLVDLPEGRS